MTEGVTQLGSAVAQVSKPQTGGQRPSIAPMFHDRLERSKSEFASPQERLRELSEMFVSSAMIMPMFEQLRSGPLTENNIFHGGQGEKIFQQQLDQVLADRMAGATHFDLVDTVYNHFSQQVNGKTVNTHG